MAITRNSGPEHAREQLHALLRAWPRYDPQFGYGVSGQQLCQGCGALVTFSGVAALHAVFRGGECVGGWQPTAKTFDGKRHEHSDRERAALHVRSTRYCELCRLLVPLDELVRDGHWRHCIACERLMADLAPEREPNAIVRALTRWRWERPATVPS